MSNLDRARSLFDTLSTFRPKLGPYLMTSAEVGARRRLFFDYPPLQEIVSEVEEVQLPISGTQLTDRRIFRAPSPWHAALLLMYLVDSMTAAEINTPEHVGPLLFRGHPDADWQWNMIPRLHRPNTAVAVETLTLSIFSEILAHAYCRANYPCVPASANAATGQHYGIATDLLDFTVHPSVAVFFAAHGRQRRKNQEAVVFFLPVQLALDFDTRITIAPPQIERLYLQRGVLIRQQVSPNSTIADVCNEVRFPMDSAFEPMPDCDGDKLLRAEPWLSDTVTWARTCAEAAIELPRDEEERNEFIESACERLQVRERLAIHERQMGQGAWRDLMTDLLYRLLYTVRGESEFLYERAARSFALENSDLISGILDSWRATLEKMEDGPDEQNQLRLIHQVWRSIGGSTFS